MAKKKLIRFADIRTMDYVLEPTIDMCLEDTFPLKGKWGTDYFKNNHPIILELGCGKGEYTVQLAKMYPDKNFVGVDIKGSRIWYGANTVREEGLSNVAFIRTKVDFIDKFFGPDEVSEIWLTFSDPQPGRPRKRLSSDLFIERYRHFLKPDGIIHLKTDNTMLFEWTLEEIDRHGYKCLAQSFDVYNEVPQNLTDLETKTLKIQTHYEKMFWDKGFDIKYCKFQINS